MKGLIVLKQIAASCGVSFRGGTDSYAVVETRQNSAKLGETRQN